MTLFVVLQVYLLSKEEGGREKPYTNAYQAQLFCKTWDAPAQMTLPSDKDMIMPGEDASIEFIIMKNMVRKLRTCTLGCSYTLRDRFISSQTQQACSEHTVCVFLYLCCPSISFSVGLCSFSQKPLVLAISHRCGCVLDYSSGQST